MTVQVAGISEESFVDGPGIRFVIFVQGCPHRCPGCHNPQTHSFEGGEEKEIEGLLMQMEKNPLQDGVTFSGGEPFGQAKALGVLAQKAKEKGINLWAYTGYTFEQLLEKGKKEPEIITFLHQLDVLVDGLFILDQRSLHEPFVGSKNQRLIDVPATLAADHQIIFWEPKPW
ncbi:MAG: anaerobic ribonucleoside-triphosphate reductase activating protein [Clostridiales bacterium]|nr:anaerobic ribonucleoside-triphosphate reductase activating protein [Clostridiales bacterium]